MIRRFLSILALFLFAQVLSAAPPSKIKYYYVVGNMPGQLPKPAKSALISLGHTATLTWEVKHADYVDINGDVYPATGTLVVFPQADTTAYVLTAHQVSPNVDGPSDTVLVYVCVAPNCAGGPL